MPRLLCVLLLSLTFLFLAVGPFPITGPDHPIEPSDNHDVLTEVTGVFDPGIQDYVRSIPIHNRNNADTAYAHTSKHLMSKKDFTYVGVSPDWDRTVADSPFMDTYLGRGMTPDDSVFSRSFKRELLTHEFLHMVEDHYRLDMSAFFAMVKEWYLDPEYGRPNAVGTSEGRYPDQNRMKYLLWFNLYDQKGDLESDTRWHDMGYSERYADTTPGVEEFAYIGTRLADEIDSSTHASTIMELPENIKTYYQGILNPQQLDQ